MRYPLLFLVLGIAISCTPPERQPTKTRSDTDIGDLCTVEHDGHKFIVYVGYNRGGLVHHPECRCKK